MVSPPTDVRRRRSLQHQLVRSMGRRTRQDPGPGSTDGPERPTRTTGPVHGCSVIKAGPSKTIAVTTCQSIDVATEDHRKPARADADTTQRPQIVCFSAAAVTVTVVPPSRGSGSGRSPTTRRGAYPNTARSGRKTRRRFIKMYEGPPCRSGRSLAAPLVESQASAGIVSLRKPARRVSKLPIDTNNFWDSYRSRDAKNPR